jgi:amidohydrolase
MLTDSWIKQRVKELEPKLIEMRRHFHQHPEIGFQEHKTAQFVSKVLTELQIEHKTGIAETGIVAVIKGGKPGKTIALRADMDALTLTEKTGLPYASVHEGVMHACGHDAHTASLLGAAMVLGEIRQELPGTIKLIFQPAEEGPGGAKPMIEQGALDEVDAIVGAHVWQDMPVGKLAVRYGPAMACLDSIDIAIIGKGCHGAAPHQGVDAVAVACQVVNALQTIASREINPVKPVVVSIGMINGGYAYNIIADEINMKGTVRAIDPELRQSLPERIDRVIAGVTSSMRADYRFSYHFGYPPLINNIEITEHVETTLKRIWGPDQVLQRPDPSMGGEDMAYYLEKVPGTFIYVGSSNAEKGLTSPGHSSTFAIDEAAIAIMAASMTIAAIDLLKR